MKDIDRIANKLKYPPMVILEPHSKETGWITAIICGRWVQAKVFDEPSDYGINNGRVSKLYISKTDTRNRNEDFFDQMCYHWDRGPDFKRRGTTIAFVRDVVAVLEKLPKVFED